MHKIFRMIVFHHSMTKVVSKFLYVIASENANSYEWAELNVDADAKPEWQASG